MKIILTLLLTVLITIARGQTCMDWCNAIFNSSFIANCGVNSDFANATLCAAYCTGVNMKIGNATDVSGNTVACRIYHANVAMTAGPNNIHCHHATQTGGDGGCGTYCEVYCDLAMNGACTGMYSSASECATACATFPKTGTDFNLSSAANWGDNVQCRIYHAGAPALANSGLHCPHAYVTGGKACASNGDYCSGYCRMFVQSCGSTYIPAAYASVAGCVRLCQGYATLGSTTYMNQTGYRPTDYTMAVATDSVDCRTYHSIAAIGNPSLHCLHASIDGGNFCGSECGVYCNLRNLANGVCSGLGITVSSTTCSSDCNALNKSGSYLTSLGDDTLQCRLYHWAAVLGLNDTFHCPHGNIVGSATCLPAVTTPTPVTSPTPSTPTTAGVAITAVLSLIVYCLVILL